MHMDHSIAAENVG